MKTLEAESTRKTSVMCRLEDTDRIGPLSLEAGTDHDTDFEDLLELAMNPKPRQLLTIWWYVDDILIGLPGLSGPFLEMLPELSGPLLEIFNIPSSDNEMDGNSDSDIDYYDIDEMYGTDCEEDND